MRKKTFGVKLHIGVDMFGLLHAMFVSTANVTDCEGVMTMIGYAVPYLSRCQTVLVDGAILEKFLPMALESC
jgi:hypothetical protein